MKTYSVTSLWALLLFIPSVSSAQVPINTFSTVTNGTVSGGTSAQTVRAHSNSVNGVSPSTNYSVNYNNTGNVSITDFTYAGKSYVRCVYFDTVIIRRAANTWVTSNGNKQHVYCQGPAAVDNITHTMPFQVAYPQVSGYNYMERVMKEGFINRGSDNIFNNDSTSDLTYNNIERVDFVYHWGVASKVASSAGFIIAERGGNDAFKIAAILAIDANGNPTQYGPVLSVATSSYGATLATAATYVMRKDVTDNALRPFSLVPTQNIKSVFVRFSDLGVAANVTIFGYSLMGNDVTATTSAQLLDYTNATYYPRTTTTANGGMDMASAPGIYHTDLVLAAKFLDVKAQQKDGGQQLQWVDEDFNSVHTYELEKSADGEYFNKITTVPAGQYENYSYTDRGFVASAYYRLKVQEKNGNYYYSPVVFAKYTGTGTSFSAYPNPASDYITISATGNTIIECVKVVSASGVVMGAVKTNTASRAITIDTRNLPSGNYFVRVTNNGQVEKTLQFIKQ